MLNHCSDERTSFWVSTEASAPGIRPATASNWDSKAIRMTVGVTNRIRIVSIHTDEVLHFRFGVAAQSARWRPLARDRADLPVALRGATPALVTMGPGETADFNYVPTQPGRMMLEVWIDRGQRVAVPVVVQARSVSAKR